MHPDYPQWLIAQKYAKNTQAAQLHRLKKLEQVYGSLDIIFAAGDYPTLVDSLIYSLADERAQRPNPSKIEIEGNLRTYLQSYKDAALRYQRFLSGDGMSPEAINEAVTTVPVVRGEIAFAEEKLRRFSLERDMQAVLRQNIASLDGDLRITDDGAERSVHSGQIDITCERGDALVVIELKAGTANGAAIGQILGYMADLAEAEGRPVEGILIAHDFDRRAKAAARMVPTLTLQRYAIQFTFTAQE